MAENGAPDYGIRIDKDGGWYYRGQEMFRRDILAIFYRHLVCDETGRYLIEMDGDRCVVEVEDCAFVVKSFHVTTDCGRRVFSLLLSDGSVEPLVLATLRFSEDNVPYCRVKDGSFDARFSRPAYYQLAEIIDLDEETGKYYIGNDAQRYYIE